MAQLIMSLNDRYAAITIAAALLADASLAPGISPENVDKLQYLRDVMLELQAEIGTEINLTKSEMEAGNAELISTSKIITE